MYRQNSRNDNGGSGVDTVDSALDSLQVRLQFTSGFLGVALAQKIKGPKTQTQDIFRENSSIFSEKKLRKSENVDNLFAF